MARFSDMLRSDERNDSFLLDRDRGHIAFEDASSREWMDSVSEVDTQVRLEDDSLSADSLSSRGRVSSARMPHRFRKQLATSARAVARASAEVASATAGVVTSTGEAIKTTARVTNKIVKKTNRVLDDIENNSDIDDDIKKKLKDETRKRGLEDRLVNRTDTKPNRATDRSNKDERRSNRRTDKNTEYSGKDSRRSDSGQNSNTRTRNNHSTNLEEYFTSRENQKNALGKQVKSNVSATASAKVTPASTGISSSRYFNSAQRPQKPINGSGNSRVLNKSNSLQRRTPIKKPDPVQARKELRKELRKESKIRQRAMRSRKLTAQRAAKSFAANPPQARTAPQRALSRIRRTISHTFALPGAAGAATSSLPLIIAGIAVLVVIGAGGYLTGSLAMSTPTNQGCDASKILEIAQREMKEGPHVGGEKYWKEWGFASRVEWCGAFAGYCEKEAGLIPGESMPDWPAWAANHAAWFNEHPDKGTVHKNDGNYRPRPGDIAVNGALDASWSQHVGIVEKCEGALVQTIDGNWGDQISKHLELLGSYWTYFVTPNGAACNGGSVIEIPEYKISGIGSTKGQRVRQGTYSIWEWDMTYYTFGEGAGQGRVQRAWRAAGSVTDSNGFNTLDGKYLIATTSIFGEIGDWVTFEFEDGTTIETVKVDAKAEDYCPWDPDPADTYGHLGGANVLEFCGRVVGTPDTKLGTSGVRVVRAYNHGHYA